MRQRSATLSVTSKGQVTFRRAVLEHLGASPGDRLTIDLLPGGRVAVHPVKRGRIEDCFGMLAQEGQVPLSIDEINEVIAAGWAGER